MMRQNKAKQLIKLREFPKNIRPDFRLLTFLALIPLIFLKVRSVSGEDLTLIGENQAIYSLGDPLTAEIKTTESVVATLEIADVVVEETRVLIRFFAHGISPAWAKKIDDPNRIVGKYLPVMELGLPSGIRVTPSSASRYSLTVTKDDLIIAGLSEFRTDEKADFMTLYFNQLPFDLEPLAEGAALPLLLLPGDNKQRQPNKNDLSTTVDGVTMTLLSVADAPDVSMFQPGISVNRPNERLSGIGWVSLSTAEGQRIVLKRDIGYGFNLADDDDFYLRNSYYFHANETSGPLTIALDRFYLTRTLTEPEPLTWASRTQVGAAGDVDIPFQLDEVEARITHYEVFESSPLDENHRHIFVRLKIDIPERIIGIRFTHDPKVTNLVTTCGVDPTDGAFACDVPLTTTLDYDMILYPLSFEYHLDEPLEIHWTPERYPSAPHEPRSLTPIEYHLSELSDAAAEETDLAEAVQAILNRSYHLRENSGWFVQKSTTLNEIPNPAHPDLIDRTLVRIRPFAYQSELYSRLDYRGNVVETISLQKSLDGELLNGTWTTAEGQISLPLGYRLESSNAINTGYSFPFLYANDFLALVGSSFKFESADDCAIDGRSARCLTFTQSLLQNPNGSAEGTIRLRYAIDLATGELLRSETDCQRSPDDTELSRCAMTTIDSEAKLDALPDDVQSLIDQFIFE